MFNKLPCLRYANDSTYATCTHTHRIPKPGHSRQKALAWPRTAANQSLFGWDPTCHPLRHSPAFIGGALAFHICNSLCLFHHLHFLSAADAFVPSISLNFNGVNFHTHTCTIKTSKPDVAHFPEGAISKIEIFSSPKSSRCPFVCVKAR